jgi:radical SAM-linked protein
LLYTQGFNARPRIQVASPLPLGLTSECEIVDVMLHEALPTLDDLIGRLQAVSPEGLRIIDVAEVPARSPTLQALIRSAEYRITFVDAVDRDDLQGKIDAILAAEQILREKKAKRGRVKTVNVRPLIHGLELDNDGNLIAHLASGDQGNLRPDVLLEEMGLADIHANIHRLRLHPDEDA